MVRVAQRSAESNAAPRGHDAIAERRLHNQLITRAGPRRPADVVAWFGAVQAQEFAAAKWALGLRMQEGTVDADIERAFTDGRILRTHVMRPTWHFVAAADIRWLLELTAPGVQRRMASYNRQLELDARTLTRGIGVLEKALDDSRCLTRAELASHLQRAGLAMAGQRLAHLVMHAELERVICSGPRQGKQFTYALLAERAPNAPSLSRDEAVATLTRRFLRSHGPATIRDFVWWSGLATAEARRGMDMIRARHEEVDGHTYWVVNESSLQRATRDHRVHLLPIYDEYLVAYRDRDAVPHGPAVVGSSAVEPVTFQHAVVIDGQVAGTWRVTRHARDTAVAIVAFRRLTSTHRRLLEAEARRYERFVAAPMRLSIA